MYLVNEPMLYRLNIRKSIKVGFWLCLPYGDLAFCERNGWEWSSRTHDVTLRARASAILDRWTSSGSTAHAARVYIILYKIHFLIYCQHSQLFL